ncbi:hypothetical protein GCM10027300_37180 [Modestobacter lapidis]
MVTCHGLGPHRPELIAHPGPELLQAHPTTVPRPASKPLPAYARRMFPSTGSGTWDAVLQIGIVTVLLISIVLLIRDYRGRR